MPVSLTTPKERPMLFSAPMVLAILDGRKTQTRRVIKLAEFGRSDTPGYFWTFRDKRGLWNDYRLTDALAADHCPYGQPGDRLWVREAIIRRPDAARCQTWVLYAADGHIAGQVHGCDLQRERRFPAIHMPRWASRITLEITGVRVERLNDISQEDALAEGIREHRLPFAGPDGISMWSAEEEWPALVFGDDPRMAFAALWQSIHGPGSWDANPWVWAISFRHLTAKVDA